MISGMKFNKSKCRILHIGQSNAGHKYKLGKEWLKSSPEERIWGCWSAAVSTGASSLSGQLEGQIPSRGTSSTASPAKRGDRAAVISVGVASPRVLCAVLDLTI